MKKIILALTILVGTSVYADGSSHGRNPEIINKLTSMGVTSAQGQTQLEDKVNCWAYVPCANGLTATCNAYGSSCQYNRVDYVGVECLALNGMGLWIKSYAYCM